MNRPLFLKIDPVRQLADSSEACPEFNSGMKATISVILNLIQNRYNNI